MARRGGRSSRGGGRRSGAGGRGGRGAGRRGTRAQSSAVANEPDEVEDDEEYYEDDGPPVGQLRPSGMTLAMKFALVISAVSAALIVITGIIIYFQASSTVDREIDKRGVDLVRQLRGRCLEYRQEFKTAYENYEKRKQTLKENYDAAKAGGNPAEKTRTREEYNNFVVGWKDKTRPQLKKTMEEYLQHVVFWDKKEGTIGDVINAVYQSEARVSLGDALPAQARDLGREIDDVVTLKTYGGVRIETGSLSRKPVRLYRLSLVDGKERPGAMIIISATQIADTRSKLMIGIALATLMAIAIGAGVSFLLASQVTSPVKRLVEDIEVVAAGDLEHRTIATSNDEIGILAQTFDIMTQKINLAHEQELEHKAREHELNIATEIQSNLLPKKIPPLAGFDLGAFYRPSKEVGGDYYDFIQIDEDNLGIIVADVAGKGVPGSMVMTMARSLIRMESVRNLSPADIFVKTNRVIAQDIKRGMFVTAMYVIINTRTQSLTVASAGHNPMVLFRASLGKCSLINPKGIALGFDKGPIFERTITEEKVKLEPGDRVVLYTDGVPEAMSPDNEEFGEKRFYKLVQDNGSKNSNQFVNILVSRLESWKVDAEQSDDITICTFRRQD